MIAALCLFVVLGVEEIPHRDVNPVVFLREVDCRGVQRHDRNRRQQPADRTLEPKNPEVLAFFFPELAGDSGLNTRFELTGKNVLQQSLVERGVAHQQLDNASLVVDVLMGGSLEDLPERGLQLCFHALPNGNVQMLEQGFVSNPSLLNVLRSLAEVPRFLRHLSPSVFAASIGQVPARPQPLTGATA